MAKKSRTPADDLPAEDEDVTTNQQEGSQDTSSVTGGPEVNYGNPPTGAGDPAPGAESQTGADQSQDQGGQGGDPNHVPTQAELDADKEPLSKDEALQLLKAGHRLRVKGEDPSQWIAMTRHAGELAISFPATDEAIDEELGANEFILAD